jgi:hypothetical protein
MRTRFLFTNTLGDGHLGNLTKMEDEILVVSESSERAMVNLPMRKMRHWVTIETSKQVNIWE